MVSIEKYTEFNRDYNYLIQKGFVPVMNDKGGIKFPLVIPNGADVEELMLEGKEKYICTRLNIKTVLSLIDKLPEIAQMRGIGAQTIRKVKLKILAFSYANMNDKQRQNFWRQIILTESNMRYY